MTRHNPDADPGDRDPGDRDHTDDANDHLDVTNRPPPTPPPATPQVYRDPRATSEAARLAIAQCRALYCRPKSSPWPEIPQGIRKLLLKSAGMNPELHCVDPSTFSHDERQRIVDIARSLRTIADKATRI